MSKVRPRLGVLRDTARDSAPARRVLSTQSGDARPPLAFRGRSNQPMVMRERRVRIAFAHKLLGRSHDRRRTSP